ncbi:SDR family oxidoreductase [Fredinandcohnia sp. QZ13]|uniref:SDR family oxidoreductase n=1 Tax=Fredinandcohnia sp. QZ13 TaxID=3073144 RepID=UPI00285338AE|nr:SDR family oxidoreductase [Fredinandcohnia sp. QZ13]MDR4886744.1 SDR family oxidoreductase [Fredinandcohnia sp. QZ13]
MKVCVVGANGQIGKQVVKFLKESSEHTPLAMVRKQEQVAYFEKLGVETVLASIADSVDKISEAISNCDAVVFTAGSGGHTGPDQTLLIDLDGAVKTIEAAEKTGVKRFVMVSALGANQREKWNEAIRPYYVAKHYADRILVQSELTYTIVRPGGLLNEEGTGKIAVGENLTRNTIPRSDVAKVIVGSLTEERTFNQAFDLVSGDEPIVDALKKL